ncbi:MAG: hypothetical protein KDC44_22020, partial [Phaeodactylibacter sp.]|nr:hypothetical protein [Phaeodactylibacter sp.]
YGPDWSEKFRMNFYTDASRLTKFQEVAGSMNKYQVAHAQQGITEATEIYNFAKMQQHAQGIKNADQRALALDRVKGLMDAAGLDGVSRKKVAELAELNPKQIRERRDAALLAVDQLMKAYKNPDLDSSAKADLALQITHKQMEANFFTVEAYIGPGAAKMTIGKQKVVGQEAYQAALSNLEMMEHAIRESGGDFIAAARNYELFKYIDRYLEAVKTSGMKLDAKMQQRVEFFSNLSVYLTQVHRGAHGAEAHLPGSKQKAIDQGADPDRLGDMDTPVTDQHLREQFEDFSDLAKDTLGKLKAHGQQHGAALTGTKVSSAGPPVVFDEFWKEAANFKYIRKHLNQPMPDSPPQALYVHYNVSWQGKQAQVSRRINDDQKFADLYVDQHNILRTAQPKGDAFHFLKQTKNKAGGNLSTKELKAELLFVIKFLKEGKVLRSKTGEYDREVTLPNGHTWKRHRDNGDWCRFSTGDCFTGGRQNRIQHILEEFAEAQQLGYDYPIKVKDKYRQVSEAEALRKFQGQNYPGKGQEHRAKVKESHDLGVEFGRVQADKDKIKILNIDFPDKWLGDFGRGLDDLGTRNGNYIFLEYKGQTADLGEGQMTSEWVGKQIALIEHQGNLDLAQDLLTAALSGQLQGIVYSSTGSPSTGEVHTKRIISGAISKSASVSPSNLINYRHKAVLAGYTAAKQKLAKQLGGK